jgi:hypothetical protein
MTSVQQFLNQANYRANDISQLSSATLLPAAGHEGSTRIFLRIALGRFRLRKGQPIRSSGVVVPSLFPRQSAGLFLGPVRQNNCGRNLYLRILEPEDHKIIARQLDPVEKPVIVGDYLAKVEPELLLGALLPVFR